jgi:hypothetical protein
MPSMNILADFQSVFQSINRINDTLIEFKQKTLEVSASYRESNTNPYLTKLDKFLSSYSNKDIFLLLSFLADDVNLNEAVNKLEDKPRDLLEKLLIDPIVRNKNNLPKMIAIAMIKGHIEDKEIMNFWEENNVVINLSQLRYQIRLMLKNYDLNNRSALVREFLRQQ